MKDNQLRKLEASFNKALHNTLGDKTPEELRQLDWFSLNPDFHIEQAKKKRQYAA